MKLDEELFYPKQNNKDKSELRVQVAEEHRAVCPSCNGTGHEINKHTSEEVQCEQCDGTGKSPVMFTNPRTGITYSLAELKARNAAERKE